MKSLSPRTLSVYYVSALLIIAVLSIASHLVLDYVLNTNAGSAAVVNLSGRQRMLSQRIASLAAQYRLGDATARADLLAAIDVFEAQHASLIERDRASQADDAYMRQLHALYFDGPTPLDAEAKRFVETARRVAGLPTDDPSAPSLLQELFVEARTPLLDGLNEAVSLHQRESEQRLSELENLHWAILALVLVTLLVEAVTIFRPMIRRIVAYTSEILRLATTDTLTGVANRRSFFERGAAELARARRYDRPLSLLMLDADHFKRVNDTYGHGAGDQVLMALCDTLRRGVRESDIVGRLGGEEFAVLMPETKLSDAAGLAERLRNAIAKETVTYGEHAIGFTVSIGVVPVSAAGLDDALKAADGLLYLAKERGRNRVVTAEPAPGAANDVLPGLAMGG